MLLCWFDGFCVLALDSLNSIVVVFYCSDHFANWFYVLDKLIINALIVLLVGLLLVRILIVELMIWHGLCTEIEILSLMIMYTLFSYGSLSIMLVFDNLKTRSYIISLNINSVPVGYRLDCLLLWVFYGFMLNTVFGQL